MYQALKNKVNAILMSGSYSPPLPLVHLEFSYLSQTKHLFFLQSWGNKSFLLEAITSTNRSNKSLQGHQTESRITWHTGETSLSLNLCTFLKGGSGGEVLILSLVTSDKDAGNGMKLNQGKLRLDNGERSFTGRVVGHWDRLLRDCPCSCSRHQACQSSRST